jgi:aspartyl protease
MSMKVVGVLLLVVCLGAADKETVLPMKVVENMVFVPVKVNGNEVVLMVDTGASNTVVSPGAAHVPIFAGGPKATVWEGHSQVAVSVAQLEVCIGRAHFNSAVVITDLAQGQRARYGNFDGLLGQDILGQFKSVRLDYQNKVVEMER